LLVAAMETHQERLEWVIVFTAAEVALLAIDRSEAELLDVHVELLQDGARGARSFVFIDVLVVQNVVQPGGQAAHRAQREGVDRLGDLHLHEPRHDLVPQLERVAVERDNLVRFSIGEGLGTFVPIGA